VASHSPQVEPLLAELRQTLPELHPQRCRIPMFSTVTARELDGPELVADYWVQNLRQPVRFGEVMQTLLSSGSSLVLELSPHPVLLPAIEELLSQAGQRGAVLPSLRREQDERATLLGSLASLWCAGLTVSWPTLFSTPSATVELPTYAWQRQRFWVDPPASASSRIGRAPATGHPLLGALQVLSTQPGTRLWEQTVDTRRVAWLRDHCVQGAMIFPAAAYLEMALSSGRERFSAEPFEISELSLVEALGLPTDGPVLLQAVVSEELFGRQRFQVASREPSGAPGSFRVHARGFLKRRKPVRSLPHIDLAALRDRLIPYATDDANQLYAELNAMGMEYGEAFRGLRQLWCGKKEALGRVELPAAAGSRQGYVLHPALLDSCLQVLLAALGPERGSAPWLPVQVSALQVYGEPPAEIFSHAQLLPADSAQPNRHRARFTLLDSSGRVVAEIAELAVQRHASSESSDRQERWYLSTDFQPKAVPPPRGQSGRWLLLGDGGALGRALRDALQQAGHAVVQGESLLPNSTALRVLLTASFGDKAPTAIVHMGRVGVEGISDSPIPEKALLQGCDSVLHVVQALVGMWYRDVPRLWLFTRGAQAASEGLLSLTQA
ncbi:MAG TPA: polyketide synthase dehydratase domain-containing protein, partial [Pseudomonadota bacterium]|nr:polyketide synthase dehydratase domain-containing protein [Pseudomonadota bacterium]